MMIRKLVLMTICVLPGCAWMRNAQSDSVVQSQLLAARAGQAEEKGDLAGAEQLLSRAVELNADDAGLHRQLASLQSKKGESQRAIDRLRFTVQKNPEDIEALVELSGILLKEGRIPEAGRSLDSALRLDPNHVEALMLLGRLEERKNHTGHALETYHRVLGIDPNHVDAKYRIALLQMNRNELEQAAPTLRSICQCTLADEQKKAEAYWKLGILYGRQGRWDDAVDSLGNATRKRKQMPADDRYRLAYARYKTGDFKGALSDLQFTLKQDPGHAAALGMMAALQDGSSFQEGRILPVNGVAPAITAPSGW